MTDHWGELPEEIRAIARGYHGLVAGISDDGHIPDGRAALALLELQRVAIEVQQAHADWLARTRCTFERNGWPWTTGELARRARLWEFE